MGPLRRVGPLLPKLSQTIHKPNAAIICILALLLILFAGGIPAAAQVQDLCGIGNTDEQIPFAPATSCIFVRFNRLF